MLNCWTQEQLNELKYDYMDHLLTPEYLEQKYNRSIKQIREKCVQMKFTRFRGLPQILKDTVCQKYINGQTIFEIKDDLLIGHETIRRILNKYNLVREVRKHKIDESFFEKINNEEKAWLLGFLIADGYICTGRNYSIRIELANKDKYILEYISNRIFKSTYPVADVDNKQSSYLNITSKKMVSDLINLHGFDNNKSITASYPKTIGKNLHNHFIRGVFDGDGCIQITKRNEGMFEITGQPKLIIPISKIIKYKCKTKSLPPFIPRNNQIGVGSIVFTGNHQIRRIRDYLYGNATVGLVRKKQIFDRI